MPTSDTSPPSSRATVHGFTLLEILVVIVLAALVMGTSLMQLTKMYDSFEINAQRDDILSELSRLGVRVVQKGEPVVLQGLLKNDSELIEFPQQWQVYFPESVTYTYQGLCSGGSVFLRFDKREYEYVLEPPLCVPMVPEDSR